MTDNRTIFLIGQGEYSDATVHHATFDKEKAEKYVAYKNMIDNDVFGHWWIEEVGVDDFEIGNIKNLRYGYLNTLYFNHNNEMTYYKSVKAYVNKDSVEIIPQNLSVYKIKVSFFSAEKISVEKAKKIAYDMIAEYKAKKDGISI